jgi:hypothetical protein
MPLAISAIRLGIDNLMYRAQLCVFLIEIANLSSLKFAALSSKEKS